MSRKIDLILRTCDNVLCHSGGKRIVDVPRIEITLRSLRGLLGSMLVYRHDMDSDHADKMRLVLVDDHSSAESVDRMLGLCESMGCPAILVDVEGHGNGDSLKTHYQWAKDNSEDLIFFLEDDYLHFDTMVHEMVTFFKDCEKRPGMEEVVLHPCDYPDRYHRELYKSWILLGENRHWRSIYHTTSTSLIKRATLDKYWNNYMLLTRYGKDPSVNEDISINQIYRKVPCFSPMPTLSIHLQYEWTLSPYTDRVWKPLWDVYDPALCSNQ
jgi:hypothetical protein